MKKEELHTHYQLLERILSDFKEKEQHYIHGNTSKIRKRALTYMESYLKRFERLVTANKDLYALLTTDIQNEDGKAIVWDELNSIPCFSRDMPLVLKKIEVIIGEMD